MAIGKRIGEVLKAQDKTAAWLSRETGIPATTIRSAISRDNSKFSYDSIKKICEALNISFSDLVPINYDTFKARQKLNDDFFKKVCDMNFIKYEFLDNPESPIGGNRTIVLTVEDKKYKLSEGQLFLVVNDMFDASYEQLVEFLKDIPEEK